MKLRDVLAMIKPLAWQGLKLWAPQIRIPADLLKRVGGHLGKAKKGSKKVRKQIASIDDMISEMEEKLGLLKAEREEWVLQWGDLGAIVETLRDLQLRTRKPRFYDGRVL